jgi:Arc/MetJ-type ribon-helix-helix transcriptional regulator
MVAKNKKTPAEKPAMQRAKLAPKKAPQGRKAIGNRLGVRLPDSLRAKMQALGVDQGTSEAAVVRRACENLVRQIEAGEDIAAIEQKIAASLSRAHKVATDAQKTAQRTWTDVQYVIAMLDHLMQFVFVSTPDQVDPILKEADMTRGRLRYEKFMEKLPTMFVRGERTAKLGARIRLADSLAPVQDEAGKNDGSIRLGE